MPPADRSRRYVLLLLGGLVALLGSAVLGVTVGAADLDASDVLQLILSRALPGLFDAPGIGDIDAAIVWSIRAPRVVLGGLIGACLGLAGGLMQGLFRNPLASPDIVGTSAGAAFGALVAISLGLSLRSLLYLPLAAVLGAFVSLVIVLRIATRDGVTPVSTLLLAGVALTALLGAANGWLIAQSWSEWEVARRIAFWMMGGIVDRSWMHVGLLLPCFAVGIAAAAWYARDLDLMLEGDEGARSLGVDVARSRLILLSVAALLTGGAVAVSGIVGFVGLVVPHLVRLLVGPGHRRLLPASALTGAWFLILCDLVARTATRPVELHLGVVTATVGAPFFLWLLRRHRSEGSLL